MKLFAPALLALSMSSAVFSAPVEEHALIVVERQTGINLLDNVLNILVTTVGTDLGAINQALLTSAGAITAQVSAVISANLGGIAQALGTAAQTIGASTVGALTALTAPEINLLISTLNTTAVTIRAIETTLAASASALSASAQAALAADIAVLRAALTAFSNNLNAFIAAVAINSVSTGTQLINELLGAVVPIASSIGNLLTGLTAGQLNANGILSNLTGAITPTTITSLVGNLLGLITGGITVGAGIH